jgi:hypothetical protein
MKGVSGKELPQETMNNDPQHHIRRVVLPSGKTIEVVYFEDQLVTGNHTVPAAPQSDDPGVARTDDLHICGSCESELVYPVEWTEAGTRHWEVTLRCPNCEWCGTGIFEQEVVDRFDLELDRGTEALVADLKRMMQANMEDQVERFVAALQADAITPDDF